MENDFERILITRDQIARRIKELAREIAWTFENEPECELTIISILSGALIFTADLVRELPLKMKIGLITVSAYPGTSMESRGAKILQDLNVDVADRHVLLVDDILDTGGTLRLVRDRLLLCQPRSIRLCVLLQKTSKVPEDIVADFVGFEIPNEFVVGYGLDYNDQYRNFPDIGVLKKELYQAGPSKTNDEQKRETDS